MNIEQIIKDLPRALISWYDFQENSKILFISGGIPECEVLFEVLKEKSVKTVNTTASELYTICDLYDYIVAVGIIERCQRPEELLSKLKMLIGTSGKLLIGADNRLAIRYFCGDKDEFTGHVFDGVDGYNKISAQRKRTLSGRSYSKAEYKKMLVQAGYKKYKFYSVMPALVRPQVLISEEYIPNESMDVRVFPQYRSPKTVFLEEENIYAALMENQMFHQMANGFFIECSVDGTLSDIDQISIQGDRGHEEALITLIKKPEWVMKKALYPEGKGKIKRLFQNTVYLKQRGIFVADAYLEDNTYRMSYVKGQIATEYFREILRCDRERFIQELECFQQILLSSSEHVAYEDINWRQFEPGWEKRKADDPNIDQWKNRAFGAADEKQNIGVILKKGYIDMVSINCFHTENGFVFFDQEFYIENLPVHAVFIRTIDFIYRDCPDLEEYYPKDELLKYFHLFSYQKTWRMIGNTFLEKLRNEKVLSEYHRQYRKDWQTVASNRHRMDYSQEEYEKLFKNIFKGIDNKKIYLFGAGRYAEQFIDRLGSFCDIAGIVDNNDSRWGTKLSGIEISSPEILENLKIPFKVFICIKYFDEVLLQLQQMGIRDISVYDWRLDYDRPLKKVSFRENTEPKKYHIGYVAGVFDLFHIGHLNLLRRAKEQCDYLIVGIVSDEQVIQNKKTNPYIPFKERLEIVQACRYVDEAVRIPPDRPNTEDAYYRYHFDVQFSGSDYAKDPDWLARKVFLKQHGSDMVFFPYTESTSSTALKEQVGQH